MKTHKMRNHYAQLRQKDGKKEVGNETTQADLNEKGRENSCCEKKSSSPSPSVACNCLSVAHFTSKEGAKSNEQR